MCGIKMKKMKILTTLTFLIYSVVSFGQVEGVDSDKRVFLGLAFSPDYSYRTISSEMNVDLWNAAEEPKFGFTTGLVALFKFNPRFALETGLQFSDKGHKIQSTIRNSEPWPPNPLQKSNNIFHYQYLDIPVKANYFILTKKLKIFVSAGISANIFLNNKTTIINEYDDGSTETESVSEPDLKALNVAAMVGVGMDYAIANRLHLRVEPIFRHSVTNTLDAPISRYPYSLGANTVVFYEF